MEKRKRKSAPTKYSCVSLKSDGFMYDPPKLSVKSVTSDPSVFLPLFTLPVAQSRVRRDLDSHGALRKSMFVSCHQVRFRTHRFQENARYNFHPKGAKQWSRPHTGNCFRFLPAAISLQGIDNEN
ncbi:hypothetical protein DPX16_23313 [Anabarilius grahami]|uniref:Uncharacterized protein n=1 Tax=Anabarilius grahami TaxID=495550 RepID=A0A3N0Z950_ANAGA|nr:hypothetical protein DPX16_23313 [Anabarilius grahami]